MATWQQQLQNVGTDPVAEVPFTCCGSQDQPVTASATYTPSWGSLEWEQKVKMGCKRAAIQRQLVLNKKQGSFQGDYSSPYQTGEVFSCSLYEYSSNTKEQFWLRKPSSPNSAFSDLLIAFPGLNK